MARRGREFWAELIRDYEAREPRQRHGVFARRHRISVGTFRLWLYRLRRERPASLPALVPVRVVASTAPTARGTGGEAIEIGLPSGARLRFAVGTDADYVAALVGRLC